MYVEEDLCDDGDIEGTEDKMILSAQVESVTVSDSLSDPIDKANEDPASCKIAEIAELAQSILKEVKKISSVTLVKYPASEFVRPTVRLQLSTRNYPADVHLLVPTTKI